MPEQVNLLIFIVLLLFSSFFISLLINKLAIKLQNKMNYVQPLREELIPIHKNKSKTPTLGGIGIYLSSILTLLLFSFRSFYNRDLLLILICTTGFFLIGLVDDLIKIIKNDAKGEKGIIKFVFEIFISFILLKGLGLSFSNFQFINIFSHHLFIGGFSIFLLSFILVGTSNSMNLTDGLDGLASTIFIIMLLPFAVYAFKNNYYAIGCYIVTMFGSTLGFIRYNINPSKQFMGDSGSLYLGSFIGSISILFHLEYILLISGIILIIETLSVIIQVIYFKITKKRIFLMSPLHHHLELLNINENKIVLLFIIITYIGSFISMLLII